ncbi:histidine phosphatase family protein [uncultured Bacteroides sp.]|jgi:broad specificity phosphatase PhoE|uniref:histidine phosphatase family protein n=1 Tax=uncultured Bacteroides sp. TaxID=162156 RepID=UPI00280BD80A|nr:histidine phosphatase family protein [uncultured Bacteroides sp.]
MVDLYIARHGQTEENVARIFQGHLPGHLTEEGKRQAVELGRRLAGIELDAVLSSDLQRVVDTVRLAMAFRNLPWEKTPLLREIDWGSWTGLPLDSVDRSRIPADAESKEMLYERAGKCIGYIRRHYQGKRLLVVAHGLINRSLRAQIEGIPADRLTSIPHMDNCEVVHMTLV